VSGKESAPGGGLTLFWRSGEDSGPGGGESAESGWHSDNLRKRGFAPETVIDVGVAHGTPSLCRAFPDAYHVLVEPLREFEPSMRQQLRTVRGEYVITAVGNREGTIDIHFDPNAPWTGSMLESHSAAHTGAARERREIELTTLDRLVERRGWVAPFGLKIDTEGFERDVIEGATAMLGQTQFVIAEVSVAERFEGGYTFAGFVALMDARGFALCDVLGGMKPSPDGCVSFIDACFRRSPVRTTRRA
jgi:FkbM family methyltransferase